MTSVHSPMPRSKHDRSLPYTYEARVDLLRGQGHTPMLESFFADTICGLVELLVAEHIRPDEVQLYGVFQRRQLALEVDRCVGEDGLWMVPPALCRALEAHYRDTMDARYRGHRERGRCMYEDRDRRGHGPY